MLTYEEKLCSANRLNKMNFHFEQAGMSFETVWNKLHLPNETNWNYKEHRHSFYEIHICLAGECTIGIEERDISLHSNTFLVIPPNITHKINYVSRDFSKFVLGVRISSKEKSCTRAIQSFEKNNMFPKVFPSNISIMNCIYAMVSNAHSKLFNYYDIIKSQLFCLIMYIIRQTSDAENGPEAFDPATQDARIGAVRGFIKDNLSLKFTNENIAQQLNISSRQLSRIVIDGTGMTVGKLRRAIQVESICEYLKNTNYSLKEIALLTGFSDEFSMSKVFKRVKGMPPKEYRKGFKT